MAVLAVQQIRRVRGGAQGHLMLAADSELYIVKFKNNPQHIRVLANELMGTRLASLLGLTVPACEVIEVTDWMIDANPELAVEAESDGACPCTGGLQFGSRYAGGLLPGQVVDLLPDDLLRTVRNISEFAGILAFDKWTGNANGRQAIFLKRSREKRYSAVFIDHGYCFNAGEWKFPVAALRGVYARNLVYEEICGWGDFEPWLDRIETFPQDKLWEVAEGVPPEWYGGESSTLERLVEALFLRRGQVRDLIVEFQKSYRDPFPNWGKKDRPRHRVWPAGSTASAVRLSAKWERGSEIPN